MAKKNGAWKTRLGRWWRIVDFLLTRATNHHVYLAAAGIAFNVLLFSIPTVVVAVTLLGAFVDSSLVVAALEAFARQALPIGGGLEDTVREANAELQDVLTNFSNAGWWSAPVMLWLTLALFSSVRTGLSAVFSMPERGQFLRYVAKDVFLLVMFLFAVLAINLSPLVFGSLAQVLTRAAPWSDGFVLRTLAPRAFAAVAVFVFCYALYRYAPNQRPSRSVTALSALLCSALWEGARLIFGWYLENLASYGRVYGIYATLAASALWVYYSALVVLFSGEIAVFWLDYRDESRAAKLWQS